MTRVLPLLALLLACAAHRDDESVTAGYLCEEIGEAFCSHYEGCYPDEPFQYCRSGYRELCCGQGQSCNIIATRTSAWVEDCTAALWAETCMWYNNATAVYPAECRGY